MPGTKWIPAMAIGLLCTLGCKQPEPPPPPPPPAPEKAPPAEEPPPPEEKPPPQEKPAADPAPDTAATPDAAPEVVDKGPKGIARFKMSDESQTAGPVDFRHRKHQKQFGCRKCHHEIEPGDTPAACGTCHGPQEEICDLQTSFHKTCSPCHNSMGMGPVKCVGCHKWIKKEKKGKEAE